MHERNLTTNEAWQKLIDKYDIVHKVATNGIFHIKASAIRAFKEPRLMAKWDCTAALPPILKNNDLNILPDSRSSYVLGDFLLYQEIPTLTEAVNKMDYVELPEYERRIVKLSATILNDKPQMVFCSPDIFVVVG